MRVSVATSHTLWNNKNDVTCRGFGFIKFTDPQSVDKVLSSPTHVIDEKKVE